ncbi:metallophosphoesterase [Halorussus marinus]|uniref:metallophosphoesterase n=1 Tax=Halorussus marinus TaxID=2505976 RepID=UPI0010920D6A|nr:metallophosphoesterase [Halorussus marinus]
MNARYRDRAVYLPDADALVVADVHVGRDAASAVEIPFGERADLTGRLADLLDAFAPGDVVVAGDLLHAFDRIPDGVAETVDGLAAAVADAGADLTVVRGNHDRLLDSFDVAATDAYRVADTVICHGHERPDPHADADRYVVGHDHPAIEIEGKRRPCLLYGPGAFRGADVLVLPAFTRLAPGSTVNGMRTGDFMSPLVTDADALRPVVRDDDRGETLEFPPLGEFRRLL